MNKNLDQCGFSGTIIQAGRRSHPGCSDRAVIPASRGPSPTRQRRVLLLSIHRCVSQRHVPAYQRSRSSTLAHWCSSRAPVVHQSRRKRGGGCQSYQKLVRPSVSLPSTIRTRTAAIEKGGMTGSRELRRGAPCLKWKPYQDTIVDYSGYG